MRKGVITRFLEEGFFEDGSFSASTFNEGDTVYEYLGYTYGVISSKGIAVSNQPNTPPFKEVPIWAVKWENTTDI